MMNLPADLQRIISTDAEYFLVRGMPVSTFLQKEMIGAFLKKGRLHALSHGTRLDIDNCVAVLPTGQLILSVDKTTYETLGLEGSVSEYNKQKYVVKVDLVSDSFRPGKKGYKRVTWCLTNRLELNLDFLVAWQPSDESISPWSLGAYLESRGLQVLRCAPKVKVRTAYNVPAPDISSTQCIDPTSLVEFFQWTGALTSAVNMKKFGCKDISILTSNQEFHQVSVARMTGFVTPHKISSIISSLRNVCEEEVPWVVLTVQGADDSPVSWGLHQHGYIKHGDHMYIYVIFQDSSYWLFKAFGQCDICL